MLKQLLPLLLTITFLLSCGNPSNTKSSEQQNNNVSVCDNDLYHYCVKVVSISDGDTFRGLTEDNEEIKFRIFGIDAPERYQAFGKRATQHLSKLIFGETVGIRVESIDYFGRSVVWVYTPSGKDVSAEMLKAGMAWHFKKYDQSKEYASFEKNARLNGFGLWADKKPIAPWEFRRKNKNRKRYN